MKANAAALAKFLVSKGYKLCTDGTENHLMLWDLRPLGLTGSKVEKVFEMMHITLNKNAVHGDKSAMTPGGVRIGAPAMTSRGLKEADFEKIGDFLHRGTQLGLEVQEKCGKKLVDFVKGRPRASTRRRSRRCATRSRRGRASSSCPATRAVGRPFCVARPAS